MYTSRETKYFELAFAAARTSIHPKARIGAVIVEKGEILGVGTNKYGKSHPLQKKYNSMRRFFTSEIAVSHNVHAELDAIIKARQRDLSNASIYIAREPYDVTRQFGMCRPCAACIQALRDFHIENVYYTTDEGFAFEQLI